MRFVHSPGGGDGALRVRIDLEVHAELVRVALRRPSHTMAARARAGPTALHLRLEAHGIGHRASSGSTSTIRPGPVSPRRRAEAPPGRLVAARSIAAPGGAARRPTRAGAAALARGGIERIRAHVSPRFGGRWPSTRPTAGGRRGQQQGQRAAHDAGNRECISREGPISNLHAPHYGIRPWGGPGGHMPDCRIGAQSGWSAPVATDPPP